MKKDIYSESVVLRLLEKQREACAEAAMEFIKQHITMQELRELYINKIKNAKIKELNNAGRW